MKLSFYDKNAGLNIFSMQHRCQTKGATGSPFLRKKWLDEGAFNWPFHRLARKEEKCVTSCGKTRARQCRTLRSLKEITSIVPANIQWLAITYLHCTLQLDKQQSKTRSFLHTLEVLTLFPVTSHLTSYRVAARF